MSDDIFEKWRREIDMVIFKHASNVSPADRQDVRQEILLAFFESKAALFALDADDENKARGLAYKIARNATISYLRTGAEKTSKRSVSLDDPNVKLGLRSAEAGRSSGNSKFFGILSEAITESPPNIDMDRAIESLSEDEQTVVRALFFEGRSQEEIAADMRQTRHWVRGKKESALLELKRLLRN